MNNVTKPPQNEEKPGFKGGKFKEILWIAILGLVLLIPAWIIFYNDGKTTSAGKFAQTDNEQKISRLLENMEGVGEAEVMVYETEEGVQGAVVVCEGANDFFVVIKVREAVATALGTEEKSVKIYLKKE